MVVLIFCSSVSQSSCLKADASFIWQTTTHNRFVVLFTSEFYRVLKRNSSKLIAMKCKLNYCWGWQQVDNSIYFFHSQNQRAKAGSMAGLLEVGLFMPYLAIFSCLHEMQPSRRVWNYWGFQPKNNHVKELNRHFVEWKSFIGMFSFPALKTPGVRDCSHQSRSCY